MPVEFVPEDQVYSKIYASTIYTKSRDAWQTLLEKHGPTVEIGGTGWDLQKTLPPEIERCKPDYSLYTVDMIAPRIKGGWNRACKMRKAEEIVSAGVGFTSRGCIRKCAFCVVPIKEGPLAGSRTQGYYQSPVKRRYPTRQQLHS